MSQPRTDPFLTPFGGRWSNYRACAVFTACLCIAVIRSIGVQDGGGVAGILTMAYFHDGNWQTNTWTVRVDHSPPVWSVAMDCADSREEVYSDGRETLWITYYPQNDPDGPLNTSMIKLFSGPRVLESRPAEHLWLALLSRSYFEESSSTLGADPGLCMNEPSSFVEVEFSKNDASPRRLRWRNKRSDNSSSATRIEGSFVWGAATNWNVGLGAVPLKSQLAVELVFPNGDIRPASFSELIIHEVGSVNSNALLRPQIKGRSLVQDYRINEVGERRSMMYDVYNGNIPAVSSSFVREVERLSNHPAATSRSGNQRVVVWIGFGILTIAFIIVTRFTTRTKTKQNHE